MIISCVRLFALCARSLGLRVGLIGGQHERERHLPARYTNPECWYVVRPARCMTGNVGTCQVQLHVSLSL